MACNTTPNPALTPATANGHPLRSRVTHYDCPLGMLATQIASVVVAALWYCRRISGLMPARAAGVDMRTMILLLQFGFRGKTTIV